MHDISTPTIYKVPKIKSSPSNHQSSQKQQSFPAAVLINVSSRFKRANPQKELEGGTTSKKQI